MNTQTKKEEKDHKSCFYNDIIKNIKICLLKKGAIISDMG